MQAKSITFSTMPYDTGMRTGRPTTSSRSDFGSRLHKLREATGLTQQQVAEQLGITQASYALWERRNVSLKADQIAKLAEILGVSTDRMLLGNSRKASKGGPVGKARKVFEQISKLPRNQQQRIVGVVEDMIAARRATS